jgi:hypothetical protein
MNPLHVCIRVAVLLIATALPSRATQFTWTNTSSGSWSGTNNWSPNGIPGLGDDVLIAGNDSYTVALDTSPTIDSLTLGGGSGQQTLTIYGNTLTLAGASFVKSNGLLALNGGSLAGNGLLTVNGQLIWTAGSIPSGNTLTVGTNGVLALAGVNGANYVCSSVLTNAGTVQLQSGNLFLDGGELVNLPGALVDLQGDVSIPWATGYEVIVNGGTVRKSGGTGVSIIQPIFNNTGTLDAQSGTLQLTGASSGTGAGLFMAEAGATLAFGNGYMVGSGGQVTGAGTNLLNGGAFTLNGTVTASNLVLAGATLGGTSGVIMGGMTWSSGSIGSGSTLTIATNAVLALAGNNGDNYACSGVLTNAGTVRLQSGNLLLSGGELVNLPGALVDLQGDVSIPWATGYEVIVNGGTVRKSGGTGVSDIQPIFDNAGTLGAQSGTLQLTGASSGAGAGLFTAEAGATLAFGNGYTVGSGGQVTGAGTNLLNGGVFTLNGTVTASNLVLAGATLGGTSGVIMGGMTWTSGSIGSGSTLTIATNAVLALAGNNGDNYTCSGVLTNAGTVQLQSGNLLLSSGELVNLPGALVDFQGDVSITWGVGNELIVNEGTVRKSGGTGVSVIQAILDNTGTLDAQSGTLQLMGATSGTGAGLFTAEAGATLAFGSGYTVGSGGQVTGAGTNLLNGGTVIVNGTVTASNLVLAGATLGGTSGVIATVLTWTSGSIGSGSALTIATNGVLALAGINGNNYACSGVLTNAGTMRLQSGNFELVSGELVNLPGALVDLQGDVSVTWAYGTEVIFNEGTVRKSGGTGVSDIQPIFDNTGTLDGRSGTLQLMAASSGTGTGLFTAEAGATLAFGNGYTVGSGGQVTGAGTNLLNGGAFTLNGTVTASNLVLAGATLGGTSGVIMGGMTWTSGSIGSGSTLTIATNGVLALAGVNGNNYTCSGVLTNAGTVQLQSGNFELVSGELVNLPGALVDLQGDVSITWGVGNELIVNEGTVRKSGGTGVSTINPLFDNTGTLDAQSGTVDLAGSYNLANGTLNFGISSLTNFGTINLSGSAALSGTLSANLNHGFIPRAGNAFQILTYSSYSGSFSSTNLPPVVVWEATNTATALIITVLQVGPTLQFQAQSNLLVLSWPTNAAGFSLETTTNLSNPLSWVPVVGRHVIGDQIVVTNIMTNAAAFFRLAE